MNQHQTDQTQSGTPSGAPSGPYQIELKSLHQCDPKWCSKMWKQEEAQGGFTSLTRVPNPNFQDGKCEKFQQEEKHCLYLGGYHSDQPPEYLDPEEKVIADQQIIIKFSYPLSDTHTFTFSSPDGFTRKKVIDCIANTYQKIYREEEESADTIEINFSGKCTNCHGEQLSQAEELSLLDFQERFPDQENPQCSICLSHYRAGDRITILECSDQHHFHRSCLLPWLEQNLTCPLCRADTATEFSQPCGKCESGEVKFQFSGKVIPEEMRINMTGLVNRHETNGKYGIWGHDLGDLVIESLDYYPENREVRMFIGS